MDEEKKMEVRILHDDQGKIRVSVGHGMTFIEAMAMLEVAMEIVRKNAVNSGKAMIQPASGDVFNLGRRQ